METDTTELLEQLHHLAAAAARIKPTVLQALAAGSSVRTVAHAAGISPTTVQKWKEEAN